MSEKINWYDDLDDDDNTYWKGESPYVDGEDGPHFHWKLEQRLEGNRVIWVDCSDSELGGDGEFWETLKEAQAVCQKAHDNILVELA